jgi:phosphoenolpyruvate synthase/pyruvate phosphate dikinase
VDAGTLSLLSLAELASARPELVGGKALGFTVLRAAGLPVPDGFVLTTEVHRAALRDSGRVPPAVAAEVARRVATLGDVPLAVRSSAAGEDGADHSHAGQYLTRLGVRGAAAALDAVLECWASAMDDRAAAYRAHRGQDAAVEMAVIVQRLAHGEAAGVCMSCDPVTGDRDTIVVNASYGLGEMIVSGLVTPDDYRLTRDGGTLLAVEPGDKDLMLVMGEHGPVEVEVPEHRRLARVLDDAQLALLHDGLLRCERVLGRPADCEFSIVDGSVLWLQCRPMTALDHNGASDR